MREPVQPESAYYLGVDPGQSVDPAALAVVQRITEGSGEFESVGGSAVRWRELPVTRYEVRWLERLRLGTPYPAVCRHIAEMIATEPLAGNCIVALDATGIGAALRDIFEAADFNLVSITITGGDNPIDHGDGRWSVPKADLAG